MARVDPDDDTIYRWVVWHYRYDPDRRERRNVVVAAYDNPAEFQADIERRAAQLRARKERGADVDPAERISGLVQPPDYRRLQRNAHLVKRAIEHGVAPAGIDDLDLPPDVGVIRAEGRNDSPPYGDIQG
ncbi:MAG: hypothetical protein WB785_12955 [Mycobacterium sp.]|uniref:hypothetical protein n=1 Tax=Mycobacterium sp. TaxID=1785 RepID=UPI003C4E5F05